MGAWTTSDLVVHLGMDAQGVRRVNEIVAKLNGEIGRIMFLPEVKKKQRKEAYTERAKADFAEWQTASELAPAAA
mgnify:CR=1 FL=1